MLKRERVDMKIRQTTTSEEADLKRKGDDVQLIICLFLYFCERELSGSRWLGGGAVSRGTEARSRVGGMN